MVGPLVRRKSDPNGKGRGGGLYYHRGNGEFSKYNPNKDVRRKHTKNRKNVRHSNQRHTSDTHKSRGGWI